MFDLILQGFADAFTPINIAFVLLGVILGTVIGLLPGLGSATGVAILLPVTLSQEPLTALIMLAGIYYGSQFGASITAILINTPGDASSAVVTMDGYALARKGRAGAAIGISAIASFVAGTLTIPLLMGFLPALSSLALQFGAPEQFALAVFALAAVSGLSGGKIARSLAMTALGLIFATFGLDPATGASRFTFGFPQLAVGLDLVAVIIGLFALSEVASQAGRTSQSAGFAPIHGLWPARDDLRAAAGPVGRGAVLGFFIGALPGAGATVASFMSYGMERRISRRKERFGKGAIEGVAGPEAANNSAVNGAFAPLLTLGVPGSATTAVLLGAFLIFGITPGPLFMTDHPEIAWGLIASFYLGNMALLILNLPLAPVFAQLLRIPYYYLYPVIVAIAVLGAYATSNNPFHMWTTVVFGLVGFALLKFDYPVMPIVLGLVLGQIMEPALTRTSQMSGGDMTILLRRPIAAGFIVASVLVLVVPWLWGLRKRQTRWAVDATSID